MPRVAQSCENEQFLLLQQCVQLFSVIIPTLYLQLQKFHIFQQTFSHYIKRINNLKLFHYEQISTKTYGNWFPVHLVVFRYELKTFDDEWYDRKLSNSWTRRCLSSCRLAMCVLNRNTYKTRDLRMKIIHLTKDRQSALSLFTMFRSSFREQI